METYAYIADVRREFKNKLDAGTVITNDKIQQFLSEANSVINSVIGTVYTIPATGTQSVNQKDTFTIVAQDSTDYFFTITASGESTTYSFTSGISATTEQIRDGLISNVNADKDRLIEISDTGADTFQTESRTFGLSYTISDLSSELSLVNDQASVLGSYGLRLLRKIEADLAACKIARILRVKVAQKLESSDVRQDIRDASCRSAALAMLKKIQSREIILDGADLKSDGSGLESYTEQTGFEGSFKVDSIQW